MLGGAPHAHVRGGFLVGSLRAILLRRQHGTRGLIFLLILLCHVPQGNVIACRRGVDLVA